MIRHSTAERKLVKELVSHYVSKRNIFEGFLTSLHAQILASGNLMPHIHSLKWRLKDADHLEGKLFRKMDEAKEKGARFRITTSNLFTKVNDLAGLRILHLHTDQMRNIATGLQELFEEETYSLFEVPTARTWDDESRLLFKEMGFKTKASPSLYTSVHYVIKPNKKTHYTCEIQVRTLMEEVWGEVDHTINYPDKSDILACREQLAALARATSSCSRLVDSIFRSHQDLNKG